MYSSWRRKKKKDWDFYFYPNTFLFLVSFQIINKDPKSIKYCFKWKLVSYIWRKLNSLWSTADLQLKKVSDNRYHFFWCKSSIVMIRKWREEMGKSIVLQIKENVTLQINEIFSSKRLISTQTDWFSLKALKFHWDLTKWIDFFVFFSLTFQFLVASGKCHKKWKCILLVNLDSYKWF